MLADVFVNSASSTSTNDSKCHNNTTDAAQILYHYKKQ